MKSIRFLFYFFITSFLIQGQDQLSNRIKIDGVSSVVGDYVILDSDIDKAMLEMESQGIIQKVSLSANYLVS